MCDDEIVFSIRNILLLQLVVSATIPEKTAQLRHDLVRMWKTLAARLVVNWSNSPVKKFWEIDMTKFEP
jgi:hypothetical protein